MTLSLKHKSQRYEMMRTCYGTMSSAIWQMFSQFCIFCSLFVFYYMQENMRNDVNSCHITRGCYVIINFLLAKKMKLMII